MRERFLNVLKWAFIIMGILFFIQIIILVPFFMVFSPFPKMDDGMSINFKPSEKGLKQIEPIINFLDDYQAKNNKYPDSIDKDIKANKNLNYTYEVSKDKNCYLITVNIKKNSHVRQYKYCKYGNKGSMSSSESYVEFAK